MVSVVCSLWRLWRPDGVSVLESWQAARADQLAGSFPEVLGLRSRWGPKDYSPHHWVGAGPGGSARRGHRVGLCLMDNSSTGQVLLGGSWGGGCLRHRGTDHPPCHLNPTPASLASLHTLWACGPRLHMSSWGSDCLLKLGVAWIPSGTSQGE